MNKNIIETVMGGVVLVVALGFVGFVFKSTSVERVDGYQVIAQFDDASGLIAGTDVRLAGVKVGTVASQRLDTELFTAVITLNVDDSIKLPADTSARIISDGLLGGNYVALEPGGDDANIEPDGEILYTQGAINVVDLLGRFVFSAAEDSTGGEADAP
jgi:phospholipid/cholesterol/gamma-HCH transport system substrate-binding protein